MPLGEKPNKIAGKERCNINIETEKNILRTRWETGRKL
jgi:hypothetical protein